MYKIGYRRVSIYYTETHMGINNIDSVSIHKKITRKDFLHIVGIGAIGVAITGPAIASKIFHKDIFIPKKQNHMNTSYGEGLYG